MSDLSSLRQSYDHYPPLEEKDMLPSPFAQFQRWFEEVTAQQLPEPNAFVLATTGQDGLPSARTVLLKYYDEEGMVFYTNYQSAKAKQLAENPRAAMLFPWFAVQRQVKIQGAVEKVSQAQSLAYFLTRPRGSRIGAWASPQSSVIGSRSLLLEQWEAMKQRFADGDIPLPDFWGGYRIIPQRFEFWQGQPNRLHDRFLYQSAGKGVWRMQRLAP